MNRILLMVLRNLHIVPGAWFKLCRYAKHTDEYPEKEKWDHIRYILTRAVRSGNINLQVTGTENIPEGNAVFVCNHQSMIDIPVLLTATGLNELVYNDFFIGDNCDVTIMAGCGIHNCGDEASRHDGVHTFYIGKNSTVRYAERHYGDGDGKGDRIMNPETVVYVGEGSTIQMDTVQIKGIDSTARKTKIVVGKDGSAIINEKLLTHGNQYAGSDMDLILEGENANGRIISRSVAQDSSMASRISNL